jgi:hypothetical protein
LTIVGDIVLTLQAERYHLRIRSRLPRTRAHPEMANFPDIGVARKI